MKYLERVNYKGFIWPLSWLTVLASLGNRVAYLMIKRFCKKSIGIGYAITGLEWLWVLWFHQIVLYWCVTWLVVESISLLLAFTGANASTTHYANGPASILATTVYVKQNEWWKMNFVLGIVYILIFGIVGTLWMKVIGVR